MALKQGEKYQRLQNVEEFSKPQRVISNPKDTWILCHITEAKDKRLDIVAVPNEIVEGPIVMLRPETIKFCQRITLSQHLLYHHQLRIKLFQGINNI